MHKEDFFKTTTIALAVVIILLAGYIGYTKYASYQNQKMQEVYAAGYNNGVADSVVKLYQDTDNCGTTSIFIQNSTRYLADVECLNKALQEAAK